MSKVLNPIERLNFQIPKDLASKTKVISDWLQESVSQFIRIAIQQRIDREELQQIEKQLEEGYKANYQYYKKESKEFQFLDS